MSALDENDLIEFEQKYNIYMKYRSEFYDVRLKFERWFLDYIVLYYRYCMPINNVYEYKNLKELDLDYFYVSDVFLHNDKTVSFSLAYQNWYEMHLGIDSSCDEDLWFNQIEFNFKLEDLKSAEELEKDFILVREELEKEYELKLKIEKNTEDYKKYLELKKRFEDE